MLAAQLLLDGDLFMLKPELSVVLAIKDESEMLAGCLKSVSWVDEIIVMIDDRTSDNSRSIAKEFTAKVYERAFDGFASQKNAAIAKATGDWILLLDADERCTADLQSEINDTLTDYGAIQAYNIPFRSFLLGKEMKHGGWDEKHIRLFRRGTIRYSSKQIHEELVINGEVGEFKAYIEHHSHRTVRHILNKIDKYTDMDAQHLYGNGHKPVTKSMFILIPLKFFIYYYIRCQGYKDGIEGLIEVILSRCYYQILIYAKLWELQR